MTAQRAISACVETAEELRANFVPNPNTRYQKGGSTGNMAFNALRYCVEGDVFHIWIDEGIAPYVYFTNEPWKSPRWNGKQNPNEGWWERFSEEFAKRLAQKLKGAIK